MPASNVKVAFELYRILCVHFKIHALSLV